jgi:hypothetical protein
LAPGSFCASFVTSNPARSGIQFLVLFHLSRKRDAAPDFRTLCRRALF